MSAKDQIKKAKKLSAKERLIKDYSIKWLAIVGQPFERELRFHIPSEGEKRRLWKFDFAWPESMVAVEIEGGVWGRAKSRHTTGTGFHNDCEKYNCAEFQGWSVIRLDEKWITIPYLRQIKAHIIRRSILVDPWQDPTVPKNEPTLL